MTRGPVVPSLDLFVSAPNLLGPLAGGNLDLNPPIPALHRVLLRRLLCALRAPPVPGAYAAVLDTGSPLALFPHDFWYNRFGWRAGRDFDELSVAGIGTVLTVHVLGHQVPWRGCECQSNWSGATSPVTACDSIRSCANSRTPVR
jgi:hypothetical protein